MASDYLSALLKTEKYQRRNQILLKERVFVTFDNLLAHCGLARMRPGQMLLDLGMADGALVEVARSKGLEARGLDVTDSIDFETDALPLADNSVDVVTAVSLIEHLRSPRMLLAETLRVLKPGGVDDPGHAELALQLPRVFRRSDARASLHRAVECALR